MNKVIFNKYNKSLIGTLPRVSFPGKVVVILTAHQADQAVEMLLCQPVVGIDTETRPSFKKGVNHKVSLLQVSTPDVCFLFRLNLTGLTPSIIRFLEDKTVLKVGLSLHDDLLMLHKIGIFTPGLFVDLQDMVKHLGIEDMSLQKIYANLFGQRISKTQQLSNWEADILNDKQKQYAATDAWTCLNIYKEINRLKSSGNYSLMKVEENTNPQPTIHEE